VSLLTGGARRRRARVRRVGAFFLGLLLLGVAVALALFALDAGRRLDRATVVTAGLPPLPSAPAPEEAPHASAVKLEGTEQLRVPLKDPPRAGLLFDVEKGQALWSRRPRDVVPIASLTKIMTALIVAERTSPRERIKVTRAALRYAGSGIGVLPRGRRVPAEGLLYGLMLVSGNDAAIALADHISGSERAFIRLMNRRAQELGLTCTRFSSAYGAEAHDRSCAADMAALSRVALDEPRVARVARRRQAAIRFPIEGGKLYLNSTNPLLRLRYPGTIGLKTGYTRRAGRTYVGIVRRDGRTLGLVLLDSPDTGVQARQIFDRAFAPERRKGAKAARRAKRASKARRAGKSGRERRADRLKVQSQGEAAAGRPG
jgi:serine-type D-Ala-D-Ala carboxypeptidase (penicillin-binding protein 5/6)